MRARRRAHKQNRALDVALAGAELPLGRSVLPALVVENVGGLQPDEAARWLAALVPCLRPGGRLIAADATSSTTAAARVAGAFLSAALTEIVQEWPRDGALLTIGVAPTSSVIEARFEAPVTRRLRAEPRRQRQARAAIYSPRRSRGPTRIRASLADPAFFPRICLDRRVSAPGRNSGAHMRMGYALAGDMLLRWSLGLVLSLLAHLGVVAIGLAVGARGFTGPVEMRSRA